MPVGSVPKLNGPSLQEIEGVVNTREDLFRSVGPQGSLPLAEQQSVFYIGVYDGERNRQLPRTIGWRDVSSVFKPLVQEGMRLEELGQIPVFLGKPIVSKLDLEGRRWYVKQNMMFMPTVSPGAKRFLCSKLVFGASISAADEQVRERTGVLRLSMFEHRDDTLLSLDEIDSLYRWVRWAWTSAHRIGSPSAIVPSWSPAMTERERNFLQYLQSVGIRPQSRRIDLATLPTLPKGVRGLVVTVLGNYVDGAESN